MGHKVNPIGLRLGINRTWDSRWYAGADYSKLLHDDLKLRAHLRRKAVRCRRVARGDRASGEEAAGGRSMRRRPGVVIGKKGQDIDNLRKDLAKMAKSDVALNIVEIRKPEIEAQLVAENIAQQLERRVAFRRAMKRAVQSAMRLGAQGIRINCGGPSWRRGDRARGVVSRRPGAVAYACAPTSITGSPPAKTTYGTCGVKVWIFKGEILSHDPQAQDRRAAEQAPQR